MMSLDSALVSKLLTIIEWIIQNEGDIFSKKSVLNALMKPLSKLLTNCELFIELCLDKNSVCLDIIFVMFTDRFFMFYNTETLANMTDTWCNLYKYPTIAERVLANKSFIRIALDNLKSIETKTVLFHAYWFAFFNVIVDDFDWIDELRGYPEWKRISLSVLINTNINQTIKIEFSKKVLLLIGKSSQDIGFLDNVPDYTRYCISQLRVLGSDSSYISILTILLLYEPNRKIAYECKLTDVIIQELKRLSIDWQCAESLLGMSGIQGYCMLMTRMELSRALFTEYFVLRSDVLPTLTECFKHYKWDSYTGSCLIKMLGYCVINNQTCEKLLSNNSWFCDTFINGLIEREDMKTEETINIATLFLSKLLTFSYAKKRFIKHSTYFPIIFEIWQKWMYSPIVAKHIIILLQSQSDEIMLKRFAEFEVKHDFIITLLIPYIATTLTDSTILDEITILFGLYLDNSTLCPLTHREKIINRFIVQLTICQSNEQYILHNYF